MKLDPFYIPTCHPNETLTSFVSRVAAMASRSARDFCLDMGLNFQDLCDGNSTGLNKFTELAGFKDGFPGTPLERTGDRWFELNGEPLPRASLSRATVRVCPHCIREDLERGVDHEQVRPYGRWSWTIASIRTCTRHNTPLIVAAAEDNPKVVHDFSQRIRPFVKDIDRHIAAAQQRRPSDLETYVESRFSGNRPDIWLSSLPAYAAACFCEIIGATKIHGAQVFSENLTEDQWYEAGQVGFEIAADGPKSIRAHLNDMQRAFLETRHAWGPKQIYGRLYEWLAHETDDTAYDPLRDIMTEHAFHTLPMGSEHEIFGRRPARRILHSVNSAHLETGAHPKRLRKVLLAVGLIDHSQLELSDERILFSAQEAKYYLDRIEESMSMTKVRTYINATRPVEQVLFKAGILKPWLTGGTEMFKDHAFAKRDLDEFLNTLTINAVPALDSDQGLVPILKAAKIANCTMPEVVQLILDGKLDTVRTDPKLTGFLSVLVDPNEIKPLVRLEDHDGFSLRTVEQKLKTTTRVVRALVDHQYLMSETAINPVNRCPQTIVKKDRLEAFNAQYATARSLGLRFGVGFQSVIKHLSSSGIEPAFPVNEVHTSIYDRKIASERLAEFYEQVP